MGLALWSFALPTTAGGGGTVTGRVKVTPDVPVRDTVVYIKKAELPYTPRELVLTDVPSLRPLVGTVGDTLRLDGPAPAGEQIRRLAPPQEPLGIEVDGTRRRVTFAREGIYVRLAGDRRDPLATLFIGQNPFAAVVDEDGRFVIPGIPPGDYELAVWNPWVTSSEQRIRVRSGTVTVNFALRR